MNFRDESGDHTKRLCLQEDDLHTEETVDISDDADNRPFELSEIPKPTEHWALPRFPNHDGIGYVLASLDSEKNTVSIDKTVLMNHEKGPEAVICARTYERHSYLKVCAGRWRG